MKNKQILLPSEALLSRFVEVYPLFLLSSTLWGPIRHRQLGEPESSSSGLYLTQ